MNSEPAARPQIFSDLQRWLFDEALPFWGDAGVDRRDGGFVEHFTLAGAPHTETKRVFVVCRQIYVFAQAAQLGWQPGAELALHGKAFLQRAHLPDTGGWARRLDAHGRPIDTTPDLYTLSFVLFALAWLYRLDPAPDVLASAHKTLDAVERQLVHPSGGFWHEPRAPGARQQNPHMHLVEALLALAEFTQDERFLATADTLVDLFATRLFDASIDMLPEFFADDLSRLATPEGRLTEPGHQFEWAWILGHYARLGGRDVDRLIGGLHTTATRYGVDPATHATYNCVRDDGLVINAGSRIWPNTERMKAAVALFERTGRSPLAELTTSGRLLLDAYLAPAPNGLWVDNLDAAGRPAVDKIPASSLYHLVLAFAEALRIAPRLSPGPANPPVENAR